MIQFGTVDAPFDNRELAHEAVSAICRADAMGLLDPEQELPRLNQAALMHVFDRIREAGIASGVLAEMGACEGELRDLAHGLRRLSRALEASPAPRYELPELVRLFGFETLAQLTGVSATTLRRYHGGARPVPDLVAARFHFLALVVGDLAGAYNEIGIRRWFQRRRKPLAGASPAEILSGEWDPDKSGDSDATPSPASVRQLSRSLASLTAT